MSGRLPDIGEVHDPVGVTRGPACPVVFPVIVVEDEDDRMNGYDAGSDRRGKRAVQRHDEGKEVIDRGAEQAEGDVLLDRQRYRAGIRKP